MFWKSSFHHQTLKLKFKFSLVKRNTFTSAQLFLVFLIEYTLCSCSCTVGKKQVPFSMAIGNGELVHECLPTH